MNQDLIISQIWLGSSFACAGRIQDRCICLILGILLLILAALPAHAQELTYSDDAGYSSREEAWEYRTIKAHEIPRADNAYIMDSSGNKPNDSAVSTVRANYITIPPKPVATIDGGKWAITIAADSDSEAEIRAIQGGK